MNDYSEGVVHLTVRRNDTRRGKLAAIRATTGMPGAIDGDSVVVKLRLRIPNSAFRPLDAELMVPEEFVHHPPVEVEAIDPEPASPEVQ